ncbi:MAG: hypothetical protein M1830_003985, partial [Pleopsidium flavum]
MSSAAQRGSDKTEDKPQRFTKLVKRVKTVLRRGSSRGSISSVAGITGDSNIKSPAVTNLDNPSDSATPMANVPTSMTSAAAAPIAVDPDFMKSESTSPATAVSVPAAIQQSIRDMSPSSNKATAGRAFMQKEKVRALFEKYGLTFDESEWQYTSVQSADRTEKPIRMRIHRTCHQCQTTFGPEKTCSNCGHPRCKNCPRYPVRRVKDSKAKNADTGAIGGLEGGKSSKDVAGSRRTTQQERARVLFEKYGLTLEPHEWQSPVARPSERVEKPIRMRIHRHCHRCQTTFGPDKLCSNCNHTRCKKCPRYPAKKVKDAQNKSAAVAATTGGAGIMIGAPEKNKKKTRSKAQLLTIPGKNGKDLVRKRIRQRVRRNCHLCEALFIRDEKICPSCQHVRCKICPRDPAKLKKYPDGYPGDVDPPPELYPPMEREFRQ